MDVGGGCYQGLYEHRTVNTGIDDAWKTPRCGIGIQGRTYTSRDLLTAEFSSCLGNHAKKATRDTVAETKAFFDDGTLWVVPSASLSYAKNA